MSPEILLEKFGYLAVFVGTFLEGEAILVLAGFFAERKYLSLPIVILVGFLGSYVGHLFWFWLGRTRGIKILKRFPKLERHFAKGIRLFERWGAPTIIISQYLYGLRITCAIVVGISRMSLLKFLVLQAISCLSWAVVISLLGYYFGAAVETVLGRAENVEKYGLVVLAAIGLAVWLYHRRKDKEEAQLEG
jgi:membrane protein DedA with SNARE-associated domain